MGYTRHTWEFLQSFGGQLYTQGRNAAGYVSRVDYLGGATFATRENAGKYDGVTLGNFININISGVITDDFETYVTIVDPIYMHEYGHTIDSRLFGPSYLFAVGIPSAISAAKSKLISDWKRKPVSNPNGLYTHDVFWTETKANRRASKYFKKHYNINNWEALYPDYPLYNPFK